MKLMAHHAGVLSWAQRRLQRVPLFQRNPRLLKVAAVAALLFLVANEIRALVYAPELLSRLGWIWVKFFEALQTPTLGPIVAVIFIALATPAVWIAVKIAKARTKRKNAPA